MERYWLNYGEIYSFTQFYMSDIRLHIISWKNMHVILMFALALRSSVLSSVKSKATGLT